MQFCKDHWAKLRQAIKDRGLDHLGAKSSEQIHSNLVDQLQGIETAYDPLMDAHNMITSKALECGGLYLMTVQEDGSQYCPICEAIKNNAGDEEFWIKGPADAVLEYARENGLVSKVQ